MITNRALRITLGLLGLGLLLAAALALPLVLFEQSDPWSGTDVSVSERTYQQQVLQRALELWRASARRFQPDPDGLYPDTYRTYLVIDLDERALWLEDDGEVVQGTRVPLLAKMDWRLVRQTSTGSRELPGRSLFLLRSQDSSLLANEQFVLVGSGADSLTLSVTFGAFSSGMSTQTGRFTLPAFSPGSDDPADTPRPSILVGEEEYARRREAAGSSPGPVPGTGPQLARWVRIEPEIYRTAEAHAALLGTRVYHLRVVPGPGRTAGHGELRAMSSGPFGGLFSSGPFGQGDFLFEHVEEDTWIVFFSNPDDTVLVNANGKLSPEETARLTRMAPSRPPAPGETPGVGGEESRSPWVARLPSGAIIELVGISEKGGPEAAWWGPDGSAVGRPPFADSGPRIIGARPDRAWKIYEIAYRVHHPEDQRSRSGTTSLEGARQWGSSGSVEDRFGRRIHDLEVMTAAFEETRKSTTLRMGISYEAPGLSVAFDTGGRVVAGTAPENLSEARVSVDERSRAVSLELLFDGEPFRKEEQVKSFLVTSAGGTIEGQQRRRGREGDRLKLEFSFPGGWAGSVQRLEIHSRSYDFAVFREISLRPDLDPGFRIEIE